MAEEIAFENGRISNFSGSLMTQLCSFLQHAA